ncbi:MAG: ORF6N domain-containing protein [Parasporobacterium sp.]|nr:ORF6N domain-containing protein [Parasporobacterium sp.]
MESRVNEIVLYEPIDKERIKAQIFDVRGYKVMLDSDIAVYFGVETKALNRAMKRNIKRFPDNFCRWILLINIMQKNVDIIRRQEIRRTHKFGRRCWAILKP